METGARARIIEILDRHRAPSSTFDQPTVRSSAPSFAEFHEYPVELDDFSAVEAACRYGLRKVKIAVPISLNSAEAGPQDVRWLALIRDLTACSITVHWILKHDPTPETQVELLSHIFPPLADSPARTASIWAEKYKFGSLYWRRGPNFYQIRDARRPTKRIFILDDSETRQIFDSCAGGAQLCPRSPELIDLIDEGLVLELGTLALRLPYRMRHWPVHFRSI